MEPMQLPVPLVCVMLRVRAAAPFWARSVFRMVSMAWTQPEPGQAVDTGVEVGVEVGAGVLVGVAVGTAVLVGVAVGAGAVWVGTGVAVGADVPLCVVRLASSTKKVVANGPRTVPWKRSVTC